MLDEGLLMIRDNTVKDSLINSRRWMMVNGLNKYFYSGDCSSSLSCCFTFKKAFELPLTKYCEFRIYGRIFFTKTAEQPPRG